MRIAMTGYDYCGQYSAVPPPHELIWLPFRHTLGEMFAARQLTPEWADVFVTVLAESVPLPSDFETCPCPTVAVMEDWELFGDAVLANAPAYDYLFVDGSGVENLKYFYPRERLIPFCPVHNFSHVFPEVVKPLAERSIDVLFVGSTEPKERFVWRNEQLRAFGKAVKGQGWNILFAQTVSPDEYRRLLCDAKIVFNPTASALQDGVNARNFEAGACGCAVLGSMSNKGLSAEFPHETLLWHRSLAHDNGEEFIATIRGALENLPFAQERANRLREKVLQPLMPRLLECLGGILGEKRWRQKRMTTERIVGLLTAFGNWSAESERDTYANGLLRMEMPRLAFLPPAFTAAVACELQEWFVRDDITQAGLRALATNPENAFVVYQFARYLLDKDEDTSRAGMERALELLEWHSTSAVPPAVLYPVKTNGMDADRILTAQVNSVRINGKVGEQDPQTLVDALRARILKALNQT